MTNVRELAVAIFTVMILCAVGLTGLSISGESSQELVCANHLRQIYSLCKKYETDYGCLPPVWTPTKPLWTFWTSRLRPYVDRDKVFCCPADPRVQLIFNDSDPLFSFKRTKVSSYGMNERLIQPEGAPKATLGRLKYPNKFLFFGDGICGVLRKHDLIGVPRHDNKAQYLFGDGHIRLHALSELRKKDNSGKWIYKNRNWRPW